MSSASEHRRLPLLALSTLFAAAFACAHPQPARAPAAAAAAPDPSAALAPQPSAAALDPAAPLVVVAATGREELDAVLLRLHDGSVCFDLDRSVLSADAEEKLAAAGDVLRAHPALGVRVEGNCDERGSEEYNLALGQRRANAAKDYAVRMGAAPAQVTAIPFGSERPRAAGHDEAAWGQNRRDDFAAR